MYIIHTVLYAFPKENLFNEQGPLKWVIISSVLATLTFN